MKTTVRLKRSKKYQETAKAMKSLNSALAGIETERKKDAAFMAGDQWTENERTDRQAASIAPDPIRALFTGIRFRNESHKSFAIAKVRNHVTRVIQSEVAEAQARIQKAVAMSQSEVREFQAENDALKAAIYEIKRHSAEEIVNAIIRRSNLPGTIAAERKY